MYGEVFMAYFAAGALNISSFDMSTFVPKMLSDKSGNMDIIGCSDFDFFSHFEV